MRVNFEILSAWDEVISLGWRENVNLQQVRSILEMESHEEKIQEIIARVRLFLSFSPLSFTTERALLPQNKEHEAKEELKRRAKQLEVQRREMTRRGQNPYANPAAPSNYSSAPTSYNPPQGGPSYSQTPSYDSSPAPAAKPFKTKGMQLGASKGRKNQDDLAAALGGLQVDDSDLPLLSQQQQEQYEEPVQQYQQQQQQLPPAPATPSKDVNPFGEVEQGEYVSILLYPSIPPLFLPLKAHN